MMKKQKNKISASDGSRPGSGETELNEWKQKAEEYLNGWKRAKADYINREQEIKKLRELDKERFKEIFVLELLPIVDNFEIALKHIPQKQEADGGQSDRPWLVGILHIKKQFEDYLKNLGLERVETVGKEFDPALHEAISSGQENNFSEVAGKTDAKMVIVKEVLAGYKLKEKVIRPARVIVSVEADKRG